MSERIPGARRAKALKAFNYIQDIPASAEEFHNDKKHFVDKILERVIKHAIPDDPDKELLERRMNDPTKSSKPNLSITVLTLNFKQLSRKLGLYFELQYGLIHIITWQKPTKTLSFLVMYTSTCIWPHLVLAFPLLFLLFGIIIPGYLYRHPMPNSKRLIKVQKRGQSFLSFLDGSETSIVEDFLDENTLVDSENLHPLSSSSSDVSEAFTQKATVTVDDVDEPSEEKKNKRKHVKSQVALLVNMRDLQNLTADVLVAIEQAEIFWFQTAGFKDEKLSTLICYVVITATFVVLFLGQFIPWRLVFIFGGWILFIVAHPKTKKHIQKIQAIQKPVTEKVEYEVDQVMKNIERDDIIVDDSPEVRLVEVFEIQMKSALQPNWKFYRYTNTTFDFKNEERLAGKVPHGVNHLSKIVAADDWKFDMGFANNWEIDSDPQDFLYTRSLDKLELFKVGDDASEGWIYDGHLGAAEFALEFRRRRLFRETYRYAKAVRTPKRF